jgi:hypothetical protein
MADDVTLTSVNFYQVVLGQMVTIEVFTGDGQASGTGLLLNGVPHPFIDHAGPQAIGTNLTHAMLHANTIVRDINPATNRTSVVYELRGGVQTRRFPHAIEVGADKGAAHYLITFVFTTEAA